MLLLVCCGENAPTTTPGQFADPGTDGAEVITPPTGDSTEPPTGDPGTPPNQDGFTSAEDTFVPEPGEFLWACEQNEDCDSGWCISTSAGKVCSKICIEDCPTGWTCENVGNTGQDLIYVCVPKFSRLCDPCQKHEECIEFDSQAGNHCIDYGPLGKFCGVACEDSEGCPSGYACSDIPTTNKKQCIPVSDEGAPLECECSQLATDLGKSTTCFSTNDHGTCYGFRECAPSGLTGCSAEDPSVEICNGQDDNCDNQVDNITVPEQCEVKNEFGLCYGILSCTPGIGAGKCDAATPELEVCDGVDQNCDGIPDETFENSDDDLLADCVDEDDDNDGLPDDKDNCQFDPNPDQLDNDGDLTGDACDPDDDNDGYPDPEDCKPFNAVVNPGAAEVCDGLDNDCDLAVDEDLCDDGNSCTEDKCQTDGSCTHTPNGVLCDDGSICTQKDVCISGSCKGNNPLSCDDGNPCTDDSCDAVAGCLHNHNAAPCDDGNACTENDKCANGGCQPGPQKNCDDGNPCTVNQGCSPLTGCQIANSPGQPPCTLGGACSQGKCQNGFCNPVDGGTCNTGNGKCPQGSCSGGQCFIKDGQSCKTKVGLDLCLSVEVAGKCTASGDCVVSSAPAGFTCPGCNGICIKCFLEVCIPFSTII